MRQGGFVVEEVVDVGGEEGEEAVLVLRRGPALVEWNAEKELRLEVVVVFALGQHLQGVGEGGLTGRMLGLPQSVKGLPGDAAGEVGM